MRRFPLLLALAGCACQADQPAPVGVAPPGAPVAVHSSAAAGPAPGADTGNVWAVVGPPRPAPPAFANAEFSVAVRLPPGLSYCPFPDWGSWNGTPHGRAFYLAPPASCTGGYATGDSAGAGPLLEIQAEWNGLVYPVQDGGTPASTTEALARLWCARPRPLPGVILLGGPALACWERRGEWVSVAAMALYEATNERRTAPRAGPPGDVLSLTLRTTRARLAADYPAFAAAVNGAYLCGGPGQPECPDDGPW